MSVHNRWRGQLWSNLYPEIIQKISQLLITRSNIASFRLVCKKWRKHSVSQPKNTLSPVLPLHIPTSLSPISLPFHFSNKPLILQVSSIYLINPPKPQKPTKRTENVVPSYAFSNPWIVMVQESNPGKLTLHHPVSRKKLNLDMTHKFNFTEVAKGYNFKQSHDNDNSNNDDVVLKVVLCSSNESLEVNVMVLYLKGELGKLKVVKQKDDSHCIAHWQKLKGGGGSFRFLDDVVIFKEMIIAVDRQGKLYKLDGDKMTVAETLVSEKVKSYHDPCDRRKRLVVETAASNKTLYLVVRNNVADSDVVRFKVYKFNESCKKWDVLERIGQGRVLFVGVEHCFFMKAENVGGDQCKGNCIVFGANCFTQYTGSDHPDWSMFEDEDEGIGVYEMGKGDNFSLLADYAGFSRVIWPPPACFGAKREQYNEERKTGSLNQQASERHYTSLSDEHEESLLSASVGQSSSDEDDDNDVVLADSSSDQQGFEESTINISDDEDEVTQRTPPAEEPRAFATNSANKRPDSAKHADGKLTLKRERMEEIPSTSEPDQVHGRRSSQSIGRDSRRSEALAVSSSITPPLSLSMRPLVTSVLQACKSSAQDTKFHTPSKLLDSADVHTSFDPKVNDKRQRKSKLQPSDIVKTETFTFSGPGDFTSAAAQASTNCAPTVKFHDSVDVDIRSDLLPTLDSLRNKHGNLIGEDTVRSKDILSSALQCLAKAVIMLKSTSPKTLLDCQVDELKSVVSDLQRVGLKVEWLVPSVDKALALWKSKDIMESLIVIDKAKAEVDEKERQFLAQSAKVRRELEEGRALLAAQIACPQIIDLDQCLGEGIC